MNEQEKQLLIQDLCARLPFGVKCKIKAISEIEYGTLYVKEGYTQDVSTLSPTHIILFDDLNIKPYLRPMSSMTEEEKEELKSKCLHTETEEDWEGVRCDVWCIQILERYDTRRFDNPIWPSTIDMDAVVWLNAHHFDFRGLIEKGLAVEVTEENNPYK